MRELEGSPRRRANWGQSSGEDMSRLPLGSLGTLRKSSGGNDKVAEGDPMQRLNA